MGGGIRRISSLRGALTETRFSDIVRLLLLYWSIGGLIRDICVGGGADIVRLLFHNYYIEKYIHLYIVFFL